MDHDPTTGGIEHGKRPPRKRRGRLQILTIATVGISALGLLIAYLSLAGDRGWPPFAAGPATSASAGPCPPAGAPAISVSSDTARPNESVIIRGRGWGQRKVTLRYTPSHVHIADKAPDSCGNIEHNWSVPDKNPSGGPDPLLFTIEALQISEAGQVSSVAALRMLAPGNSTAPVNSGAKSPTPPTVLPLMVKFAAPGNGGSVPRCSMASGTALNVPADRVLWTVIQVPDAQDKPDRYYIDFQLAVDGTGKWAQKITVGSGGDEGRPYWVQIYEADRALSQTVVPGSGEAHSALPGFFYRKVAEAMVYRLAGDNCPA